MAFAQLYTCRQLLTTPLKPLPLLFLMVLSYGLPLCVCTDQGGENAEYTGQDTRKEDRHMSM